VDTYGPLTIVHEYTFSRISDVYSLPYFTVTENKLELQISMCNGVSVASKDASKLYMNTLVESVNAELHILIQCKRSPSDRHALYKYLTVSIERDLENGISFRIYLSL